MKRIVTGPRAVTEAIRAQPAGISVVYLSEKLSGSAGGDLQQLAREHRVQLETRSAGELDALASGIKHQGVVAIGGDYPYISIEELLAQVPSPALLVALDEITDPHNFGAIVRSAVALGAHGVITLKQRAAPVTPTVVRASAGATEHARIARVTNLAKTLELLRRQDYEVVGLAGEGEREVSELGPAPFGRVLVVGSEGRGLRRLVRKNCDQLMRIPLAGPVESLNASVAAGIALDHAARALQNDKGN